MFNPTDFFDPDATVKGVMGAIGGALGSKGKPFGYLGAGGGEAFQYDEQFKPQNYFQMEDFFDSTNYFDPDDFIASVTGASSDLENS